MAKNLGKRGGFGGFAGVGQGRQDRAVLAGFSRHKGRLVWPFEKGISMKFAAAILALGLGIAPAFAQPHNIVIFVADGLRYGSVTKENMPNMFRLKSEGVDFVNSHSLFPTVTTVNASAIATGHYIGDTGDFGNGIWTGMPMLSANGAPTAAFEND